MTRMMTEAPEVAVRERLMAAATELFTRKGYAATSVREIVEAAGVAKPALYYWFGSKEGIYLELMDCIRVLYEERVAAITGTDGTVRQRLVILLTGMFDGAREHMSLVRLAYAMFYGPQQGAPPYDFNRFFDHTLELVRTLLEEGMSAGEFREVDAGPAVWAVVGSYHTLMEEQFCRQHPRIDRQGLVQVINLILDGLAPAAAGCGSPVTGVHV